MIEMPKNLFLIVFFCLYSISCQNNTKKEAPSSPKIIPFPQEAITPRVTDYFSYIEPIPLETSPECQIGRIDKLVIKNDLIFIQDYTQKTLFLFDINGKFKNKINAVGRGPGEFRKFFDFYVDSETRTIEILEGWKIMRYDFLGKYINETKLERSACNFYKTKNGNYWLWAGPQFDGNDVNTLVFIDKKGKIINEYFPWDKKGRLVSNQVMFSEYGDNILFRPFAQDYTIRYLTDIGEVLPGFYVAFGKFAMPSPFKEGDKNLTGEFTRQEIRKVDYAHGIIDVFETNKYITFSMLIGGSGYVNYVYSKKHSRAVFSKSCSKDAVLPHALLHIYAVDGDFMYGSMTPQFWFDFVQPRLEKSPIDNEKLMSLSKRIKSDDNDILFKLKINDAIFESARK